MIRYLTPFFSSNFKHDQNAFIKRAVLHKAHANISKQLNNLFPQECLLSGKNLYEQILTNAYCLCK